MALKEELKEQEKNCVDVKDYIHLALKALEEPSDVVYAKELLETAEEESKFPDDFIAIAEVYAKINETNKAEELYETAEENAFEAIEFAKLAHSIFLNLHNTEKSLELYKNSIKEAKKLQELTEILSYVQSDFPEDEILKEIVNKITLYIKNIEDLKKILLEIQKLNKEVALTILKEYEKKIDGIEQNVAFANLLNEMFYHKEWAKQILEDAIEDAKFSKEFILLAKAYQSLNETEKVGELLQQAKDFATNAEENIELAFAVWELQKDKELAASLIQKSYKNIKNRATIAELIKFSKENLESSDLAKEILNNLVQNPTSNEELLKNIIFGFNLLNDSALTIHHFNDSLNFIKEPKDLITFGNEYYKIFNDKDRAKEFYQKALNNSSKFEHYVELSKTFYQTFGSDEFIATCLKICEQNANSTTEFIELAKLYNDLLNDSNNAKRCLECAEEIVASLQDIKTVVENVKKYFSNDENWLIRVEDKLKKRESNQSKYDEFLKLEKDAKYLKDYLELVDKIIQELDDIYYAKKLLNKANDLLDKQYLNIENYFKLCQSILKTTKDHKWVETILNSVFQNKIRFISELYHFLNYVKILISDKEQVKGMVESYINGWKRKIKDVNEAIKLAKIMYKFNFSITEIEDFLFNFVKNENSFENLYKILDFSLNLNFENLTKSLLDRIWGCIQKTNEIVLVMKLLLKYNFDREILISKYFEFSQKAEKQEEILSLVENYSKLFGIKNFDNFLSTIQKRKTYRLDFLKKIRNIVLDGKYW